MKSCTTELGARFFSVGLPGHRQLDGKTPISKRLCETVLRNLGNLQHSVRSPKSMQICREGLAIRADAAASRLSMQAVRAVAASPPQ